MLNCPPTRSCGSLTGSSATVPFWFCRADSSFSACAALAPAGGRVEQVVRHRVVALVLVDQGETTRGLAGPAVLAGTGGRDLQRAAGDLGVGHPVEGGRVALRRLVHERVAEGVDA